MISIVHLREKYFNFVEKSREIPMFSIIKRILLAVCIFASVQGIRADRYQDYIDRYSEIAIAEQAAHGIPASITLAQGLLESGAGRSTLATEGNNHFGIKCHSDWTGETMLRNDDAPDECFRVYDSPEQSFADHSAFLKRKRYAPLFELEITDYSGWAAGLKKCGYATDPNYASRLTAIIERYSLYLLDGGATHAELTADFIHASLRASHPVRKSRGLHYVIAAPGDTYASIGKELGMNTEKLLAYNDADCDGEIKAWEEVYLQPKKDTAPEGVNKATIGQDETLHSVAQRFGMTVEAIRALNPKAKDRPGTRLKLR